MVSLFLVLLGSGGFFLMVVDGGRSFFGLV